ncbi:MAG: HD domain-containing protein [Bacteroidota bacterium]
MKIRPTEADELIPILRPETQLERDLIAIPAFQYGLLWGEPRFGHPEGVVGLHVGEVLENINRIQGLEDKEREQLRLVALAHDTFKYAEDRSRPRNWEKHHAVLARKFMEKYTRDTTVLNLIEAHDDAYYLWLGASRSGGIIQIEKFFERVGSHLRLYYLFFKCDTQTGDKTQAPLRWFEELMKDHFDPVVIRPYWPWEKQNITKK